MSFPGEEPWDRSVLECGKGINRFDEFGVFGLLGAVHVAPMWLLFRDTYPRYGAFVCVGSCFYFTANRMREV